MARWLQARAAEVYVIHPSSVEVSREHRRAKTDHIDIELLMRALGWLRGEKIASRQSSLASAFAPSVSAGAQQAETANPFVIELLEGCVQIRDHRSRSHSGCLISITATQS